MPCDKETTRLDSIGVAKPCAIHFTRPLDSGVQVGKESWREFLGAVLCRVAVREICCCVCCCVAGGRRGIAWWLCQDIGLC